MTDERPNECTTANPAIASRLQPDALMGRGAELTSLGGKQIRQEKNSF